MAPIRSQAEEQRHAVQDGSSPMALEKARANAMTFQQLAELFLEKAPLSAKTRRAYEYALEKDAYPAIGAMPAADVTADHVLGICQTIEAREIVTLVNGKKMKRSPRVQSQRTKTTIGGVFRWAKDNGHGNVKVNPAKDVAPRVGVTRRNRTPTDDELAALWAVTEDTGSRLTQPMRLIIQLSILTAQRRDEVAGARKSELRGLDTDSPVWIIPGDESHRGLVIEGRTKNGREQHVHLSEQAAGLFRKAVKLSTDEEYVFPADMRRVRIGRKPRTLHINGDSVTMAVRRIRLRPITDAQNAVAAAEKTLKTAERSRGDVATARKALEDAKARLKEAKPIADFTIHDARRAMSTWLKNQGVSRDVRDLMENHLGQSVDERHYSAEARMEAQVRAAFQAWADHVSVVIGQPAQASNVIPIPARA